MEQDGRTSDAQILPCWQDAYDERHRTDQGGRNDFGGSRFNIEAPEIFMSLVVPAFNEEERLGIMLTEATQYLRTVYGDLAQYTEANGNRENRKRRLQDASNGHILSGKGKKEGHGWEIIVVSDGSTDRTVDAALQFAKKLGGSSTSSIRVVQLDKNRGKGGAVTHGMRHVRGQYAVFADADGASKFEDLGKLVQASQKIEDSAGRSVAVGSRAHLVGSEAVVQVSSMRTR